LWLLLKTMTLPAFELEDDFSPDDCLRQMLAFSSRLRSRPAPDDVTLAHLACCLAQCAVDMHEHLKRGGIPPGEWMKEE
jgi:hypothetical protein